MPQLTGQLTSSEPLTPPTRPEYGSIAPLSKMDELKQMLLPREPLSRMDASKQNIGLFMQLASLLGPSGLKGLRAFSAGPGSIPPPLPGTQGMHIGRPDLAAAGSNQDLLRMMGKSSVMPPAPPSMSPGTMLEGQSILNAPTRLYPSSSMNTTVPGRPPALPPMQGPPFPGAIRKPLPR